MAYSAKEEMLKIVNAKLSQRDWAKIQRDLGNTTIMADATRMTYEKIRKEGHSYTRGDNAMTRFITITTEKQSVKGFQFHAGEQLRVESAYADAPVRQNHDLLSTGTWFVIGTPAGEQLVKLYNDEYEEGADA